MNLILAVIMITLHPVPYWICGPSGAGHMPVCQGVTIGVTL
jgi:hypothetical protein